MSKTAARLAKLKDIVWKHEDLWSSIVLHNPRSKKMKWWMEQKWNPWYSNWLYALPRVSCDDDACSLLDEAPGGLSQLREEAHSMGIPIPDIGSKFLGFIRVGSMSPTQRAALDAAKKRARKKAMKKIKTRVHDQRANKGDPMAWVKQPGVRDQRATPGPWNPYTPPPSVSNSPQTDMSETYPDQSPQSAPQYAPSAPSAPTPQYEDEEYDEEYEDDEDYEEGDDEEYDRGPPGGVSVEGWFDRVLSSSRSVYRGIQSHRGEIASVSNLIVPGSGAALLAVITLEDQIERARRGDPHALDQLARLRAKANAGDKDAKKAIETAKKINTKLEQKSA